MASLNGRPPARPGAASVTYSSETLSTLPVYHLITTRKSQRSLSTFLVLVQVPTGVQIINEGTHWSTMARSMTISDIAPVEVFGVMLWARTCGNSTSIGGMVFRHVTTMVRNTKLSGINNFSSIIPGQLWPPRREWYV